MNIYIEIDKNEKDIVVKNHISEFEKLREVFQNHVIDFSSISQLKGNKELLNRSFIEERSTHITN
jgi:hypothetical protein